MIHDEKRARDEVDALLAGCDPVERSALDGDELESALDEIGGAITTRSRRRSPATWRPRLARRRTALIVGAAVVALGAAVASAAVLSAHTGRFPTKAEQAMGGPGEELNPAAPDFLQVAHEVASDVPYPAGYESWRDFLISDELRTDADESVVVSSGALHGWFAASAFCAWVQSWRQATIAGDANATAQAAQTIAQAPDWKAVTDEDPHPDPSAANDPGAETGTLFGWMLPYRDGVLAGDRARVEQLLAAGYGGGKCWSSDPDWMAQVRAHGDAWRTLSPSELAQKYEQFLASARS
jgi:hypothetical protein